MRKYATPAVVLAALNAAWIAYGVTSGWSTALTVSLAVVWVAVLALVVHQARKHA